MFFRIQSKGSCFLVDGIPPEPKPVVASRGQFTQKEASSSSRYSTLLHPRTSNSQLAGHGNAGSRVRPSSALPFRSLLFRHWFAY